MKMFKYEVTVTNDSGDEVIVKTNNPRLAVENYAEAGNSGLSVILIDGTTGEVLAHENDPTCTDYRTPEFWDMFLDYLAGRL